MTQERIKTTAGNAAAKIAETQRDLTWLNRFAKELRRSHFYGKVELTYQDGKIVGYYQKISGKPE